MALQKFLQRSFFLFFPALACELFDEISLKFIWGIDCSFCDREGQQSMIKYFIKTKVLRNIIFDIYFLKIMKSMNLFIIYGQKK